jgi:Ca2+-binding RTX toxin-like protein
MLKTSTAPRTRLGVEGLEDRAMMSVTSAYLGGDGWIYVAGNDSPSNVSVNQSGSWISVRDTTNGRVDWFSASGVQGVYFAGGNGSDDFRNNVSWLQTWAYGLGGNDYLEGYNAVDHLFGGDGDDTLVGYGDDDWLHGGNGTDKLYGMAGNDVLDGGNIYVDGHGTPNGYADVLVGGSGADSFRDDLVRRYRWSSGGYYYWDGSYYNQDYPQDLNLAEGDSTWSW